MKKIAKFILWTFAGVVLLLVLLVIAVQLPVVQNFAKEKAVNYLQQKIGSVVKIDSLRIHFPHQILIWGIYLEDKQKDTLLYANYISIGMDMTKLLQGKLFVNNIELDGITTHIYRLHHDTVFNYDFIVQAFSDTAIQEKKTPDTSGRFTFLLNKLRLKNILASFKDNAKGNNTSMYFSLPLIELGQTKLIYNGTSNPIWKINTTMLTLANNSFSYDDDNEKPLKSGMDYNHLNFTKINVRANNIFVTEKQYSGNIEQATVKEKSGVEIKKLTTVALYSEKEMSLKKLLLQTNNSTIQHQLIAKYTSVDDFKNNTGNVIIDAVLNKTSIAVKDIITIIPMLSSQLRKYKNYTIDVNTIVKGAINHLHIPAFNISGIGNTSLQLSGKIQGLPDIDKMNCDITLQHIHTENADIIKLLPDTSIIAIRIPEKIQAKGYFKGTMNNFITDINIVTDKGNIQAKGHVKKLGEDYSLEITLDNTDIGYFLKQEKDIGTVTMTAGLAGNGMNYKTMNTTIHALVSHAHIGNYDYRSFALKATLRNGQANVDATMNDSNLTFQLQGDADISKTYPSKLTFNLTLDTVNLHQLYLTDDTLSLSGHITASVDNAHPDSLEGKLVIENLNIAKDTTHYTIDSLTIIAAKNDTRQSLSFTSKTLTATLSGKYKLTEIDKALLHTINRYYQLPGFKDTFFIPQQWQLHWEVASSPLTSQLLPMLSELDTITGNVLYNSDSSIFNININTPEFKYNNYTINDFSFSTTAAGDALHYKAQFHKANSSAFDLHHTSLTGSLKNNELSTTLHVKDKQGKNKYRLDGILTTHAQQYKLHLNSDSLLLNYDKWQVSKDNYIQYDSADIIISNFVINKDDETLKINSPGMSSGMPVVVDFSNFNIKTLSSFSGRDTLLANGIVNGKAQITNIMTAPLVNADITLNHVFYMGDTIENIAIKINNETANTYMINMKIDGGKHDLQLKGKYFANTDAIDLLLDIHRLNISAIKPLLYDYVKTISGNLQGKVAVSGTTDKPVFSGDILFKEVLIVPAMSGEPLHIQDAKITITPDGIKFNQFALLDALGNKMIIEGDILTPNFTEYKFALNIIAENFTLVNTSQAENHDFYGALNIDARIKISGTTESPHIDVNIKPNAKTNFVIVLPGSDPSIVERASVVRFVNMTDSTSKKQTDSSITNKLQMLQGVTLSANIETDSTAQFTVIVDEQNEDALKTKGRANLMGGIDETGRFSLTGSYTLSQGSYQVTVGILKRTFLVQKNSVITWSGDPASATLNITAAYLVEAPPIDLLYSQIAGRPESDIRKYKQKLPFTVILKMSGDLKKPKIAFNITLAKEESADWRDVETRLDQLRNDESGMNKQVFALLLLNHFVQETTMESAASSNVAETMAMQSVSRLLSSELNRLAGGLLKGMDVSMGVNTEKDYSGGEKQSRTEVNVGVSKSVLNDRLKITVGGDFAVQGGATETQNASNVAGDIALDYKLTKDGRYTLRFYSINKYKGVVEGQVIETGLTFGLTLDYNQFRELFQKKKKNE